MKTNKESILKFDDPPPPPTAYWRHLTNSTQLDNGTKRAQAVRVQNVDRNVVAS
jgi:hypothetical protein